MSLADRTPTVKQRGTPCSVGRLIEAIDPDEAKILRGWLADSDMTASSIHDELVDEFGIGWGTTPLERHRRGHCKCDQ